MSSIDLCYFDFCQYPLRYKFIKNFKHAILGDCQLLREKTSSQNFILKEKDCFSPDEYKHFLSIMALNRTLATNQNLIKMHAYTYKLINQTTSQYRFYVFYEYMDQDLEKDLSMHQKANEDYKETVLWKLLLDITSGLIGLISHNSLENIDLRPSNIFLYRDLKDTLSYKFFYWSFGLSPWEQVQRGLSYYKFYLSPEEINVLSEKNTQNPRNNNNPEKIISFSLGLMILNLASANATYERIYKIDKVSFDEDVMEIKEKFMCSRYSENLCFLIKQMINKNNYERPTFQEILLYCKYPQNKLKRNLLSSSKLSGPSNSELSLSLDLCKPEELPKEILEKQALKQSLAMGIDRIGPLFDKTPLQDQMNITLSHGSSNELKKSLLEINNKNLEDKLENLKHSFKNRLTVLQDRISIESKQPYNQQRSPEFPQHTARKSSKFRPSELNDSQVSTVKKINYKPQTQDDYVSDNEWTGFDELPSKLQKKTNEIPEFIANLERTIIYTQSGELKKGLVSIDYPDNSKYIGQVRPPDYIREGVGVYYFSNGDIYLGEWQNNKIQGKGIYYFSVGEYYEGKFMDFQRHGGGIYQYNTGNRYEGEWRNDQKSGFGIFVYYSEVNKRETYEGSWCEDEKDGEGIYTFANGDKFVGRWKKGKKLGKGMVLFSDHGVFQGEWYENYANGYGVLRYENGDMYEGNYNNGVKHGGGIYCHQEDGGSKYAGQWLEDERTGNGVYYYSNGDKYTGTFLKGKRSGQGEYLYNNGDAYVGYWFEDKKTGYGEFTFQKGGYYKGYWEDNMMDGDGFMMYCNGDYYEGQWNHGLKHGHGIYFWVEGTGFEGEWESDQMIMNKGSFINKEGIRF